MIRQAVIAFAALSAATASGGELSRRFELSLERVLAGGPPRYTDDFLVADLVAGSQRRFSEFSGDLSGRYLGATSAAGPRALEAARRFAPRIFALEQQYGGFGTPLSTGSMSNEDMAKLWGHGRMLVGLLDYYEASGDPQSLTVARRVGDYLIARADRLNAPDVRRAFEKGHGANGYICWTQNVEGLARLAKATGDNRYGKAAAGIVDTLEILPGQHAHGMLSTLRGMALLAEADPAFLPRLEREWDAVIESGNVRWNGGPPEYLGSPGRDEGCASADWLRLNLALWRKTQQTRYIDAAEDALFNAFFGNQLPSGDFGHVTFEGEGLAAGAVEAWWCCTLHGLRTFPEAQASAFRAAREALYYDLPVDGRGIFGQLEIEADAEPARDGRVTLRVIRAPTTAAALHIRKPSHTLELSSPFGSSREAWLVLDRVWKTGETFDIHYSFETKLVQLAGVRMVKRGPWTLGISQGGDAAFFNEGSSNQSVDFDSLTDGDRPSRAAAAFHANAFGGQAALVTFRPIGERWEEPGNALRWTTHFDARPGASDAKYIRLIKSLYEDRRAFLVGALVGVMLAAVSLWLWRRLRPAR